MSLVKRDVMDYSQTYPNDYECVCGHTAKLTCKDVTTSYKGQLITIKDVPVYECSSGHIKTARITRVKMKSLLKTAYEDKKGKIDYK